MKFNQVTIKDIARELGISPSTVSRALKDHPDISTETKKAVNDLAEKLNYQPNIVALSLRQKKTNTIGVIIPEIVHFFFSTVISGIEDVAYQAGYNVILAQSNESIQREATDIRALFNSRVDGMLISISRETVNFDHIESILSKGVPIIFFDRNYGNPNTSKVIVDDYAGAREAELGVGRLAEREEPVGERARLRADLQHRARPRAVEHREEDLVELLKTMEEEVGHRARCSKHALCQRQKMVTGPDASRQPSGGGTVNRPRVGAMTPRGTRVNLRARTFSPSRARRLLRGQGQTP